MSKQYLTVHTVDDAHPTDIFALAPTSLGLASASGASSIKIHALKGPDGDYTPIQTLERVHKLGCHHLAASEDGRRLASAGFGGEVKVWSLRDSEDGDTISGRFVDDGISLENNTAGELWALALSSDGQYLASSSFDGRINVWDLLDGGKKIREYETKGSFGTSVDISSDGRLTASGHQNGGIYIFSNDTARLLHSLPSLAAPVRSVRFSPGTRLLAAAGDSKAISLYDVSRGEQVAVFSGGVGAGHTAWVLSLAWNFTGEYLLSASFDGKAKVWGIDARACVATHQETDRALWAVAWLPKGNAPGAGRTGQGASEMFATAGANRSISFYREATGG